MAAHRSIELETIANDEIIADPLRLQGLLIQDPEEYKRCHRLDLEAVGSPSPETINDREESFWFEVTRKRTDSIDAICHGGVLNLCVGDHCLRQISLLNSVAVFGKYRGWSGAFEAMMALLATHALWDLMEKERITQPQWEKYRKNPADLFDSYSQRIVVSVGTLNGNSASQAGVLPASKFDYEQILAAKGSNKAKYVAGQARRISASDNDPVFLPISPYFLASYILHLQSRYGPEMHYWSKRHGLMRRMTHHFVRGGRAFGSAYEDALFGFADDISEIALSYLKIASV